MGTDRPADLQYDHGPESVFQQYVLQQLPLGGMRFGDGNAIYLPRRSSYLFTKGCFRSMGTRAGLHSAILGCPFDVDGSAAPGVAECGNGCANRGAFRTQATTMNRSRPFASTTILAPKNTTWFRFQTDNGLQAAYTDPINPLFNAISPQPLYSFAAGYTHVFSQNLVNYFNPGVLVVRELVRPRNFSRHLPHFRSCCRAAAGTLRSRLSEDSTIRGFKGGKLSDSLSTIISPGARALTSCASARTCASFA